MENKKNEKILEDVKLKISISNFQKEEKKYMEKTHKNVFKIATIACCAILSITGIAFAKDIGSFIKNLFGANTSDGVDTATNNGYIANVKTETQKANGIELKIDSFILDDFNFAMNFHIKLDETYNIDEFEHIDFTDLKIIDESGNTVFVTHTHPDYLEYNGSYSFLPEKINDRELKVSLSATGNPEHFPKSKQLIISFSKIATKIFNNEQTINNIYEGNWNFQVDVPEEFYHRENIKYTVRDCNDEKTSISKVILSDTALKIELTTSSDKIDYELLHSDNPKNIYDKIALQKEYAQNSNGEKFETAQRSDGDGGYSISNDNIINYHQTFNLTKYDATDNITIHIFTNKGEEIIIELEKEK